MLMDTADIKPELLLWQKRVAENDKMSIHQGRRTILKLCIIYNLALKYIRQKLTQLKGKVNKSQIWNIQNSQKIVLEKGSSIPST